MFDFPATPAVGDHYPTAPLPGQPVYRWDGTVWTTKGVVVTPLRKDTLWTDGSSPMLAQLTLAGDPTSSLGAADRHYADGTINGIAPPAGSVRYDVAQGLNSAQQGQARSNMGVVNAFPPGATMVFYQAAAPVGWTQSGKDNDKGLRVVSGASGGSAGGTNAFSSVMAQTAVGNTTVALSQMPSGIASNVSGVGVNLYIANNSSLYLPYSTQGWAFSYQWFGGGGPNYMSYQTNNPTVTFAYGSWCYGAVTISNETSQNTGGGAHNHPLTMNIQYCDIVVATKD